MLIEIVTHCYANQLPHYASALTYHLSSLHKEQDIGLPYKDFDIQPTVCYSVADKKTSRVVDWFDHNTKLNIRHICQPPSRLGRRCIGRNIAAKESDADVVWFNDVDQCFCECLGNLFCLDWPNNAVMIYPKDIMIHQDHQTGDKVLNEVKDDPRIEDIELSLFVPKHYRKAIGGVQIVKGDFARKHGYLDNNPKWQNMKTEFNLFGDFRDDIAYRNYCLEYGDIVGVDLPGLYRMRHTKTSYQ